MVPQLQKRTYSEKLEILGPCMKNRRREETVLNILKSGYSDFFLFVVLK